jgi:GT2 family glycosyltransferase
MTLGGPTGAGGNAAGTPCGAAQPASPVPRASIITVNTNERHRLETYLPSVTASRGDFEIIISDNGSRDGSREYLAAEYPAVRVVCNGANIGFCAANNRAAEAARGEFLVFLNPDTTVDPDWLMHLLAPFRDPAIGMTTAKILLMSDPSRVNTCGNDVHLSGLTLCRGLGQAKETFRESEEVAAVSGAAFAIRRDLFRILGGFDEDFFIYMDETDLSCRARLAGWRCLTAPQSCVWHDYRLRFGANKLFLQERNRYRMLLKTYRWPTLIVLSPVFLLAEIITWGFVVWKRRTDWREKWRAYADIRRHWHEILKRRNAVQRLRTIEDRDLVRKMSTALNVLQVVEGPVARMSGLVLTPLFSAFRWMVFALVWW